MATIHLKGISAPAPAPTPAPTLVPAHTVFIPASLPAAIAAANAMPPAPVDVPVPVSVATVTAAPSLIVRSVRGPVRTASSPPLPTVMARPPSLLKTTILPVATLGALGGALGALASFPVGSLVGLVSGGGLGFVLRKKIATLLGHVLPAASMHGEDPSLSDAYDVSFSDDAFDVDYGEPTIVAGEIGMRSPMHALRG